jgi:hypothetical protein
MNESCISRALNAVSDYHIKRVFTDEDGNVDESGVESMNMQGEKVLVEGPFGSSLAVYVSDEGDETDYAVNISHTKGGVGDPDQFCTIKHIQLTAEGTDTQPRPGEQE